jgi:UDP-N-acetylmuramyl pentapeptide phosphotransferase/UDP-N-acetylglucosamine-1-phosphate transferase
MLFVQLRIAGGLIGLMAFMINQPFVLVVAGGVFVAELLSVVIQKGWFKYTRLRFRGWPAGFSSWRRSTITYRKKAGRRPRWCWVLGHLAGLPASPASRA